jgi:hypothetical protein
MDYRRGLAFHEAGHAVVAWYLGLQVGEIAIVDDPKDDSGTDIATEQEHLPEVDRLAVCLAGLEAESFFEAPTQEYAVYPISQKPWRSLARTCRRKRAESGDMPGTSALAN